jgi:hypothetical protein
MALKVFSRNSLVIAVVAVVAIGLLWALAGAVAQPRVLAKYREDYQDAKFAKEHPRLIRVVKAEEAVRASEVFARDYERLEDAGYVMAPIRAATTAISHDKYESVVNPTEREQFEKERKEREEQETKEDAERLKEIREKEKAEAEKD